MALGGRARLGVRNRRLLHSQRLVERFWRGVREVENHADCGHLAKDRPASVGKDGQATNQDAPGLVNTESEQAVDEVTSVVIGRGSDWAVTER